MEPPEARQHYNVTLAALTIAGIAYALQQTMVVPALPALQRDIHTVSAGVALSSPRGADPEDRAL